MSEGEIRADLAIDTTVIETAMVGEGTGTGTGTGTRAAVGIETEAQVGTVARADEVCIGPLLLFKLSRC